MLWILDYLTDSVGRSEKVAYVPIIPKIQLSAYQILPERLGKLFPLQEVTNSRPQIPTYKFWYLQN